MAKKIKNIVAKFARQFNKSVVFDDITQYKRKPKHRKDSKHDVDDR